MVVLGWLWVGTRRGYVVEIYVHTAPFLLRIFCLLQPVPDIIKPELPVGTYLSHPNLCSAKALNISIVRSSLT